MLNRASTGDLLAQHSSLGLLDQQITIPNRVVRSSPKVIAYGTHGRETVPERISFQLLHWTPFTKSKSDS